MNTKLIYAFTLIVSLFLFGQISYAENSNWQLIGKDRQANISGMALIEHTAQQSSFLIVHDNKKKKQLRAGIITTSGNNAPQLTALNWLGKELPVDLEAVTTIPGIANNFMAFVSTGKVYHIELDRNSSTIKVIKSFDVPSIPAGGDFEGFSLQRIGDEFLAVWAERGDNEKAATLFWSKFDPQTYSFTNVNSVSIKVPYPSANVRHISEVKVDSAGKVFIASAADPGNDGPFASAIYLAGTFEFSEPTIVKFNQTAAPNQLFSVDNRKIEAFELLPEVTGGMVFGTDDENLGSAIYLADKR